MRYQAREQPERMLLGLYTVLGVVFWCLVFGPGGGGTSEIRFGWSAAAINLLLVIPLWRGHTWPLTFLALGTLGLALFIASGGLPPDGPLFGSLAGMAAIMFVLLCAYGLSSARTRRQPISS